MRPCTPVGSRITPGYEVYGPPSPYGAMKIVRPREELRPYVRYYWTLESDAPLDVLTFPIGCPQIIFHRGTPLYIPELDACQSAVTISGQVNFPAHIRSGGNLNMLVAVFYPHTVGMFIDTPPDAFYNREISGDDIDNAGLREVAARILGGADDAGAVAVLERWLVSKINPTLNLRRIGASLGRLMGCPSLSVTLLADAACLSSRQYERIFRTHVGMNPKEYARVVRFQRALRMMQCGSRDYVGMAADCGYADQSHMIRDFRALSGHTPAGLPDYCIPYSDLYTNPPA